MTFFKRHVPGFVLIEVMIALFLFGMMMYGGLGLYKEIRRHKKHTATQERQEKILRSLASYALIYGRLPWAVSRDGRDPGHESIGCDEGGLPFKTLGLPESESKDGFGRAFSYVVATTRAAAVSISPWESYCRAYPTAPLLYEGYLFDGDKDFIVVALLSGGESGSLPPLQRAEGRIQLPARLPQGASLVWVTRNTLATCYGTLSCAPFHQPLPDSRSGSIPIPRGFGR
jgi:type II secretory pathway pseudopilin PulG